MNKKVLFLLSLSFCLLSTQGAIAGGLDKVSGNIKGVDSVNRVISLSVQCDKYASVISSCKERVYRSEKFANLIEELTKKAGNDASPVLEQVLKIFRKPVFADIHLKIPSEEMSREELEGLKKGQFLTASVHDEYMKASDVVVEPKTSWVGILTNMDENLVLTIVGDDDEKFLLPEMDFSSVYDLDILEIKGTKENNYNPIVIDTVKSLGIAGRKGEVRNIMCEVGLSAVSDKDGVYHCIKRNDGYCDVYETKENSLGDCSGVGGVFSESIKISKGSFDENTRVFYADTQSGIIKFVLATSFELLIDGKRPIEPNITNTLYNHLGEDFSYGYRFPISVEGTVLSVAGSPTVLVKKVSIVRQ